MLTGVRADVPGHLAVSSGAQRPAGTAPKTVPVPPQPGERESCQAFPQNQKGSAPGVRPAASVSSGCFKGRMFGLKS